MEIGKQFSITNYRTVRTTIGLMKGRLSQERRAKKRTEYLIDKLKHESTAGLTPCFDPLFRRSYTYQFLKFSHQGI